MASYQARQRDPLLDSRTQAMLEQRGKELFGVGLLVFGVLLAMILGTYSPDDPGWLAVTDMPANNMLGRLGAAVASPLIVISGFGAWSLVAIFGTWGLRFMFHFGEDRALASVIFAPIAVALTSVYASTHVPGAGWEHSFGLGGLFGDTVLGALLGIVPAGTAVGLKLLSFLFGVFSVAMVVFVIGANLAELRVALRFVLLGLVVLYVGLLRAGNLVLGYSGKALRASGQKSQELWESRRQRSEETEPGRQMPDLLRKSPVVSRAMPAAAPKANILRAEATVTSPQLTGSVADTERSRFLPKIPSILKRAEPEPKLAPELFTAEEAGLGDLKEKIAAIVRNRAEAEAARVEPAVTVRHPRGPQPIILAKNNQDQADLKDDQTSLIEWETDDPFEALENNFLDEPVEAASSRPAFQTVPVPDPKKVVQHSVGKPVQPSRKAQSEAQPAFKFDDASTGYETPPLNLLTSPVVIERQHLSDEALEENARMLESVLDDYGVKGEIVSVRPGPVVTMYELEPAPGLKASRVIGLADDIARSMSALSARVSTVPGRSVIGIELPNAHREKVVLREILSARDFGDSNMRLPLALGKDIGGDPVVANLAKMPHLLIAGTTGSGKSVAINTMILSLLYKLTPEECRLIMIDPKMLELSVYDGIPHLLSPVVTDPKKAVVALKWVVGEMEERYRRMSKMGVRNIEGFNGKVREALAKGDLFKRTVQTGFDDETGEPVFEVEEFQPEALPYIVVIVDEMADLMMVAGKEIEACIQRLAQMARASGIHLIMATQRPSVDVITGTIKANFPTRISFQVTSKIDSRTILGEQGAEQLLGMGDMLYMAGGAKISRVHGPFVSDEEVEDIVNHLKSYGPPEYVGSVVEGPDDEKSADIDLVLGLGGNTEGEDALYDQAVQIVLQDRKCSTSYIQRKLAIGYNKAARLVEQMEETGLVSAANHVGKREILVPEQ